MKKIGIVTILLFLALLIFHSQLEGLFFKQENIGKVLSIDNSNVVIQGVAKVGAQRLDVKILTGKYKGKIINISNLLNGSLEYDEFYNSGDHLLVALTDNNNKLEGKALTLIRIDKITILALLFLLLLFIYAGRLGIKSLISFVGTIFIIWGYLIPKLTEGQNLFSLTILSLIFLSALIIFLVAGFTRKGVTAFLGTLSGLAVTAILTFLCGDTFKIDGMNQPFAQAVLFSSATSIDILSIFYVAIIIGASGAAMDIAMDIAAIIEELKVHTPTLSRKQLIHSGFNVGKSVIGTMTTTLLLAYSGGFLTLMILFLQRDMTLLQILNMKMMTSEIIKILIGSIGLVAVAPITTYIGATIYSLREFSFSRNTSFPTINIIRFYSFYKCRKNRNNSL